MNEIMSILSPLLGDELAEAIIQHRKAKKPPFTAYAAKLQVKEYIKTGDPIAAAEMQILRGWTAIKASWYFSEMEKEKKITEAAKPVFKSVADRFPTREAYQAYLHQKNSEALQ